MCSRCMTAPPALTQCWQRYRVLALLAGLSPAQAVRVCVTCPCRLLLHVVHGGFRKACIVCPCTVDVPCCIWLFCFPDYLTLLFKSDVGARYSGFVVTIGSPCVGGTWSSTGSPVSGSCPGVCSAGYSCPAGSTSATAVICPAGTYSGAGQAACTPCPLGRYGSTTGQTSSVCTGACSAPTGSLCGVGMTSSSGSVLGTYYMNSGYVVPV